MVQIGFVTDALTLIIVSRISVKVGTSQYLLNFYMCVSLFVCVRVSDCRYYFVND